MNPKLVRGKQRPLSGRLRVLRRRVILGGMTLSMVALSAKPRPRLGEHHPLGGNASS